MGQREARGLGSVAAATSSSLYKHTTPEGTAASSEVANKES